MLDLGREEKPLTCIYTASYELGMLSSALYGDVTVYSAMI